MYKYEIMLKDIEEILNTIGEVNRVSHGKAASLDEEDTFTSVYITPEMDNYEPYKLGTDLSSYTNTFYIRLTVHMDCSQGDLDWLATKSKISNALLNDNGLWGSIIDRDLVSVAHDDYTNYPRKAMAMLFEFKIREDRIS